MKGFALLFCALVAVQARSTSNQESRAAASLGENPWVVHLRIATSDGAGLLSTCGGSLVASDWVLTAASCLTTSRFIWLRFGTVEVFYPQFVSEATQFQIHPGFDPVTRANNLALVNLTRVLDTTDFIAPISVASDLDEVPTSASYCGFGALADAPGERLRCYNLGLNRNEDGSLSASSDEVQTTRFDLGAPLVSNGKQIGVLTASATDDNVGTFTDLSEYASWIATVTRPTNESEEDPDVQPDEGAINIVN